MSLAEFGKEKLIMPQQTQSGAASSVPTPKTTAVLVIETAKQGVTAQQIMAVIPSEIRATVKLYLDGKIRQWYWSFHNLGDIFLFTLKVMLYILWHAPGWEDVTAQYIGGDALSCYRSASSGERCRGDREAAGCTLGQCITLAYKMAARWTEGS